MNIQTESYGHAVILILKGELDADSLGSLKQTVERQLRDREVVDLVLNLEDVPFIDSEALQYLLDLQELLAERLGQVKLVKPDENVLKILEMTRLKSNFEVFWEVPEAAKVTHD
jgi:stage II sporulation protein AA (anti-sigma F factor antagonist)